MSSRRLFSSLTPPVLARHLFPVLVAGWVGLSFANPSAAAVPQGAEINALAAEMRTTVFDDDPNSAAWIEARVAAGLPAGVLAGLADACRQHPRTDLVGVLMDLSEYRRPEVRARALAARAELGGQFAISAIEAAADDLDPGVRKVGVALAGLHPSAAADEILNQLRALDPEIAAMQDAGAVPVPPPAAPEDEEDDEIEIFDEEPVPFSRVEPGSPLDVGQPPPDMLQPLTEAPKDEPGKDEPSRDDVAGADAESYADPSVDEGAP